MIFHIENKLQFYFLDHNAPSSLCDKPPDIEKKLPMDACDKKIAAHLTMDGRASTQPLSEKAGVTQPTVRSRITSMIKDGVLKVAGLIRQDKVDRMVTCLIGIRLEKYQLSRKMEEIAALDGVSWAAVVTGRFDVIAEVVSDVGNKGINRFLTEDLGTVEGVQSTETFIVMTSQNKWSLLPDSLARKWAEEDPGTK